MLRHRYVCLRSVHFGCSKHRQDVHQDCRQTTLEHFLHRQLQHLGEVVKTAGLVSHKQLRHQNISMGPVAAKKNIKKIC